MRPGDFENKTHPGGAPETNHYFFFALPQLLHMTVIELICHYFEEN
jgi:hypothetical protein